MSESNRLHLKLKTNENGEHEFKEGRGVSGRFRGRKGKGEIL